MHSARQHIRNTHIDRGCSGQSSASPPPRREKLALLLHGEGPLDTDRRFLRKHPQAQRRCIRPNDFANLLSLISQSGESSAFRTNDRFRKLALQRETDASMSAKGRERHRASPSRLRLLPQRRMTALSPSYGCCGLHERQQCAGSGLCKDELSGSVCSARMAQSSGYCQALHPST